MDQHDLLTFVIPFEHFQAEQPDDLRYWCINCDNDLQDETSVFCSDECEDIYLQELGKENLLSD